VPEPAAADVIDLLAAVAYTELSAVSRLACDAEHAPGLAERVALTDLAAVEHDHHRQLVARIEELGGSPLAAMAPFVAPVDAYHDRTRPGDWWERLVKAYVGDGIGADFYREVAGFVDDRTRELVEHVAQDRDRSEVLAARVSDAVADDARLAGRLALWARRLVGEALSQAHRVVVDRPALARLVVGVDGAGADLAEVGRMMSRLTDRHAERMRDLGLSG
jgi:hypothetical protein